MFEDTPYYGTLSEVPTRNGRADLPVVPTTSKRARGKVKGNARKPRASAIALTDCKVYKSREDWIDGKASRTIEKSKSRTGAKRNAKRSAEAATVMPEVTKINFRDAKQLFGN